MGTYLMGLGDLAGPTTVFKRKFRWTLGITTSCGGIVPAQLVKIAARPNLTIDETEINFLNGKMFIPGKGVWETITVTFYDVNQLATAGNNLNGLWSWLASVYEIANSTSGTPAWTTLRQSSALGNGLNGGGYGGQGTLVMWDGAGNAMETWTLNNMWPQAINFGDLDYAASDEVTIECTMRYSNVNYVNNCGTTNIAGCYLGCGIG